MPAPAIGALRRLEQLIQEAVVTVPRALIAETIDLVAVLVARLRPPAGRTRPRRRAGAGAAITASRRSFLQFIPLKGDPCMIRTNLRGTPHMAPPPARHPSADAGVRPAYASGSSMPWEAPLQAILQSIEGPVAKIIAVIIIIVTGLTLAFGDTSPAASAPDPDRLRSVDRLRRSSSFFLSFFSFGGGALI
jgi:hypothetical protein